MPVLKKETIHSYHLEFQTPTGSQWERWKDWATYDEAEAYMEKAKTNCVLRLYGMRIVERTESHVIEENVVG